MNFAQLKANHLVSLAYHEKATNISSSPTHTCQKCRSPSIIDISGKTSDMCSVTSEYLRYDHEGYVPGGLNIGDGDYLEFSMCLDCGQIQGEFPVELRLTS